MCAQVHSRGCEASYVATDVTAPMEALKAELQTKCLDKDEMNSMESNKQGNTTEKCQMEPALVPCVGNVEMCFNSMDPAEICK